jgi:hypothetical protein
MSAIIDKVEKWHIDSALHRGEFSEFKGQGEPDYLLAHLIINNIIFCNDGWWFKKEGKGWQDGYTTLHVNCNDFFVPAADAEDITYSEIEDLYRMWEKDPSMGVYQWVAKKRGIDCVYWKDQYKK